MLLVLLLGLLELKFAVCSCHWAASLSSQAFSVDVCGICWRIIY